jgi:hypothetical protein
MPNAMVNRRGAHRYPPILVVEIIEFVTNAKRTSDVSRTGCYVDTRKPSAKGARLRLNRGREVPRRAKNYGCVFVVGY